MNRKSTVYRIRVTRLPCERAIKLQLDSCRYLQIVKPPIQILAVMFYEW